MTHNYIWNRFKECFDPDLKVVECWFPNGKNAIRVRTKDPYDFIFTYESVKIWKIESVDSWLESVKVEVNDEQ